MITVALSESHGCRVEIYRCTDYHFHVIICIEVISKPSSVDFRITQMLLLQMKWYNVTREETSEIAAFHGLVRVVDDIF